MYRFSTYLFICLFIYLFIPPHRYKNGKKLHKLFNILMSIMTDICQRQFRFLKFSFGPVCPNPRCPGSSSDGTVRRAETSSDESDEGDDDRECEGGGLVSSVHSPAEGVRRHVICIDPTVPSKPMWCNSTPVHEFEEIRQWFVEVRKYLNKESPQCLIFKTFLSA